MRLRVKFYILLLFLAKVPSVFSVDVSPQAMQLYVFSDGVVEVNLLASVDPTKVLVFLELPGSPYQSILVLDHEGLPLQYSFNSTGIATETLGATSIEISYYTSSLTSKFENIWTLNLTSTIPVKIILPAGSMVIGLNDVPLEIGIENDNPFVTTPSGMISVSYLQGTIDQRTLAEEAIEGAKAHLNSYKDQNLKIPEAEAILIQSETFFEQGDYSNAIDLAQEAIQKADNTAELASQVMQAIASTSAAIQNAREEERIMGLEDAENLLEQAKTAYDNGEYIQAQKQAFQSKAIAEIAEKSRSNILLFIGIIGILIIVVGTIFYTSWTRRKKKEIYPIIVDLDTIFEENPTLRVDDKEVIRYIVNNNGELFANEVRERFDIPRTSLWRMIRRLTQQNILEERKVGGQSLISIHRRYRK